MDESKPASYNKTQKAVAEGPYGSTLSGSRVLRLALLIICCLMLGLITLLWASVDIPFGTLISILTGEDSEHASWNIIVRNIRLPRLLTASLVGLCLGLAGLQLQTLFRNPLASPFTLGISSGATLGVALTIWMVPGMAYFGEAGVEWVSNLSTISGAALGAFGMLGLMLAIAYRVKDMTTVLLFGVIAGALIGALVTVLVYFGNERETRAFVEWGFGSFNKAGWAELPFFTLAAAIGLFLCILAIKPLNALLLGERYARSLGVSLSRTRLIIMAGASILAGAVIAYAGPIGFIGIAVPHLCRALFHTSDHRWLVPATCFMGIALALACGLLAEWPGASQSLPVNAATALAGAPVAAWVLLKSRKGGWL
ncbi:FecCD family ABC transporter permease [Roseivirga sp. BDSF3-8]|uniref:FecCD family ABC transporter permease n=1 Tax=Roseivirga sp. BDSF3-8 TaxID=3241598 RepID=UPI0035322CA6